MRVYAPTTHSFHAPVGFFFAHGPLVVERCAGETIQLSAPRSSLSNCLMTSTCVAQRNAALVFSQSSLPSAGNKGDAPPPADVPLSSERETSNLWSAAAPFGCVKKARHLPSTVYNNLNAGPARWRSWSPERRNSLRIRECQRAGIHFVSSHSSAPRWPCCSSGLVTVWWSRRTELAVRRVRNQLAVEWAEWPSPRRPPWQSLF